MGDVDARPSGHGGMVRVRSGQYVSPRSISPPHLSASLFPILRPIPRAVAFLHWSARRTRWGST